MTSLASPLAGIVPAAQKTTVGSDPKPDEVPEEFGVLLGSQVDTAEATSVPAEKGRPADPESTAMVSKEGSSADGPVLPGLDSAGVSDRRMADHAEKTGNNAVETADAAAEKKEFIPFAGEHAEAMEGAVPGESAVVEEELSAEAMMNIKNPGPTQVNCNPARVSLSAAERGRLDPVADLGGMRVKAAIGGAGQDPVVEIPAAEALMMGAAAADADRTAEVIPILQAQVEPVLMPFKPRRAAADELVLAAVGEAEGLKTHALQQRVSELLQPTPPLQMMSERILNVEELAGRFGEQVLAMVQQGEKVTRITVQPAELGELTVLVREENQRMSVEIHSQNEGVRELIAKQEDAIRRLMQDHHVEMEKFNVLLKDHSHNRDRQHFGAEQRGSRPGGFHGIGPASKESAEPEDAPRALVHGATSWVA